MTNSVTESASRQAPPTHAQRIWAPFLYSDKFLYLCLFAFSFAVAAVNIRGPYLLRFIDIQWPADPSAQLSLAFSAWSNLNLGDVNVLSASSIPELAVIDALSSLGIGVALQEVIVLGSTIGVASVFFYKLCFRFVLSGFGYLTRPLSIAAALAYSTNYIVQTLFWWDNIPNLFFMLALGAVFLYLECSEIDHFLRSGRFRWGHIAGIAAVSSVAFSVNIPFNVSLAIMALSIPLIHESRRRFSLLVVRRYLIAFTVVIAVVTLASLWWILPTFQESALAPALFNSGLARTDSLEFFAESTQSLSLPSLLTVFYGYQYPSAGYTAAETFVYSTVASPFDALLPLIWIAGMLVPGRKSPRLEVSAAICLGYILLLLGVNSPAVGLYSLGFNSPLFLEALRNPVDALGFGFVSTYIISLSIALGEIVTYLQDPKRSPLLLIQRPIFAGEPSTEHVRRGSWRVNERGTQISASLLCVALLLIPLLGSSSATIGGDAVPTAPYQARASIPTYEYQVADFLQTNLNGRYALLYPGGLQEQNWTHGYDGFDVMQTLLPRAFLIDESTFGFTASSNQLLSTAYTTLAAGATYSVNFASLLTLLDVKYIVVEGEIGGNYPFTDLTPPNYSKILGSLNRTGNLTLAQHVGPDFVYENSQETELFNVASNVSSSSDLIDGFVNPEVNITHLYYNLTTLSGLETPRPDLTANWSTGISVTITNATRYELLSSPLGSPLGPYGPPTLFNALPLAINVSEYPYLILNYSTGRNTAIAVSIITSSSISALSYSNLTDYSNNIGGEGNDLGYGDSELFASYGVNHFSNGTPTLMVQDLRDALPKDGGSIVYYLLFEFFPTNDQGSGLNGLPLADWPGNQSLRIYDISLGVNHFEPPINVCSISDLNSTRLSNGFDNLNAYFNSTVSDAQTAPADNFHATWNGSLVVSLNTSEKSRIANETVQAPLGPSLNPILYNVAPLDVNTSEYPLISLDFRTNLNTAISVTAVTVTNLSATNYSTLAEESVVLGGPQDSLGYGDSALDSAYGVDHFYSPNSSSYLQDDLQYLLRNDPDKIVNYLLVFLYPVMENGSGLPGVPITEWPGSQNLTISSLQFGSTEELNGSLLTTPSLLAAPASPTNGSLFALTSDRYTWDLPLTSMLTAGVVDYTSSAPTSYSLSISTEGSNTGLVLVVFHQTYAPNWVLSNSKGIVSWSLTSVDGCLLGFILKVSPYISVVLLTVSYAPQAVYSEGLVAGFSIALGFLAIAVYYVVVTAVSRLRLRGSNRSARANGRPTPFTQREADPGTTKPNEDFEQVSGYPQSLDKRD